MAEQKPAKPGLIRKDPLAGRSGFMSGFLRAMPAWIVSIGVHAVLLVLFFLIMGDPKTWGEEPKEVRAQENQIEPPEPEPDLEMTDVGLDPQLELAYDVKRIAEQSVPGPTDPTDAVGIADAPVAPPVNIPPPPGSNMGQGGATDFDISGAIKNSLSGGYSQIRFAKPGGFRGRSGATRDLLNKREGGNDETAAAVARGLQWLSQVQTRGPVSRGGGSWSLDEFPMHYVSKKGVPRNMMGRLRGTADRANDTAGTAFGLLPFLGAGITHKSKKSKFAKTVGRGLEYLVSKQDARTGAFPGGMYAHGLASIAMCEAYALTFDPLVGRSAQKALNYIAYAQDPSGGGWRYSPRQAGDTSVVGWQLMALKSGQMAGLQVNKMVLKKAEQYVDSVEETNSQGKGLGQFGYTGPQKGRYTMSAVGLLCRQYLGALRRSPSLLNGTKFLLASYPASRMAPRNMYYTYYAAQVMHHMGGDRWKEWNLGKGGQPGMRETLLKMQDRSPLADGSFDPKGDAHAGAGGRIMKTSLCLLTLEVYYRHLPLYRRGEVNAGKKMMKE